MHRIASLLLAALTSTAVAVEIEQANPNLLQGTHWDDDSEGTIFILQPSGTEPFIFWAHADNDPDTLASINLIFRDLTVTSGTIRLIVAKPVDEVLTPGATDIGAITIDHANVTTIVEQISITGNLLTTNETQMTVDQITGPIDVGGSLTAGLTVNDDLEGPMTILDSIESGADVEVIGDVTEPISVGVYVPNRTASTNDSIPAVRLAR